MEEEQKRFSFWELIKTVVISILIVIPIRMYIAQPFIVEGASMHPTYETGEYLIIDEVSYRLREPARGDVIVFRYPLRPSSFFIKRIIGLPGETVEINDSRVAITTQDGRRFFLDELYLSKSIATAPNKLINLSDGQYFVMGDNRSQSSDSRAWGALPRKNIIGRAWMRLFPFSRIGFIAS